MFNNKLFFNNVLSGIKSPSVFLLIANINLFLLNKENKEIKKNKEIKESKEECCIFIYLSQDYNFFLMIFLTICFH